ncbi:MauE/DoxX family redox-associated membrane protein [Nonomuraea sp. NPDC049152]|uniref:MauE/DoxX family redox-associated membrane protein n=1 Tax=Nonomuraea sp. NPDC049152 TaxID=3154350 RepID=UPI003400DF94
MLESQLPILIVLLALGTFAKLATVHTDSEPGALTRLGPAVLVPGPLRKPALVCCAVGELALAAGLLLTTHPLFRWGTVVFFALSTYVLLELRRRRPDAGCGCFGEVSSTPVGVRSIARTVMLTGMALMSVWAPLPGMSGVSWWTLAGVVVLAVLSPELEEAVDRIRYRAPCEQRPSVESVGLAKLKASSTWRSHADELLSAEPYDSWRELCWRFFVFANREKDDVVFAVYLTGRHPVVRMAVVGRDDTDSMPEYTAVSA